MSRKPTPKTVLRRLFKFFRKCKVSRYRTEGGTGTTVLLSGPGDILCMYNYYGRNDTLETFYLNEMPESGSKTGHVRAMVHRSMNSVTLVFRGAEKELSVEISGTIVADDKVSWKITPYYL
jgi:hypothetical protein